MVNDTPSSGVSVIQPFVLAGWAIDLGSSWGSGVDTIHVWAYPNPGSGATAIFLGVADYGGYRPDVGLAFGNDRFSNSGYGITVSTLQPGNYQIVLYAHSTGTGTFNQAFPVNVVVTADEICQASTDPPRAPLLSVSGERFHVDGTDKDLLMISYFDGLDNSESSWNSDFDYFKTIGVDGVRLFPNWWAVAGNPSVCSPNTLFMSDRPPGQNPLNPEVLARLHRFLQLAADKRLIVNVTFSRETVCGSMGSSSYEISVPQYKRAIAWATCALKPYRNVLFDLQNEWPKNWPVPPQNLSREQDIRNTRLDYVRRYDPGRIVVASTGPQNASFARDFEMDAAAIHDPRDPDWFERTDDVIEQIRSAQGGTKPIYFSEPMPWNDDPNADHFRRAWQLATEHRAASWVFHTRASFIMTSGQGTKPLRDLMEAPERAALESLRGKKVNLRAWSGYLAAEIESVEPIVRANRPNASLWETFQLHDLDGPTLQSGHRVTLRAANNLYLQAERNGMDLPDAPARLWAVGLGEGAYETFLITKPGGGEIRSGDSVSLRTAYQNQFYVVAEGDPPQDPPLNDHPVHVNRTNIGAWETFEITIR